MLAYVATLFVKAKGTCIPHIMLNCSIMLMYYILIEVDLSVGNDYHGAMSG